MDGRPVRIFRWGSAPPELRTLVPEERELLALVPAAQAETWTPPQWKDVLAAETPDGDALVAGNGRPSVSRSARSRPMSGPSSSPGSGSEPTPAP